MIEIKVDGIAQAVRSLAATAKQASRATEKALDYTAKHIQSAVQKEMLISFSSPVEYTIKSVKVTPTKGHNMTASVWIATPNRMEQSYLVPQVEGGARQLKGFERGLDGKEFVPASGVKLNASGNIPVPTIKKALGSKRRGAEYVHIKERHGKLWPGVYQRIKSGKGFNRKTHRTATRLIERGRTRGRFSSAIVARGLKPIMIEGRTGHKVKPELDFYGVARSTFSREFDRKFWATLDRFLRS
ncbi:MAG: hypothetical protein EOL92_00370 [Bacteroidia bacterium]|nr:hypothetical protein [Bacteroidia bacterium]